MATYTPETLGITPPLGGFQTGGWYSGRQYWDGTLSDPGTIHPGSNQQGAGQDVSKEVVDQTSPDNWDYIQRLKDQQNQQQPTPATTGAVTSPSTGASGAGVTGSIGEGFSPDVVNLPDLYENLYSSSGINELEDQLTDLEGKYLEAKGKISDNPFLSASMIDQRLQRLDRKYDEETEPLRSQIMQEKADIETQLNLETKQFDINSQAAQQALNRFNTLLEIGALDNIGGEDIAQLTRSTGLSSSVIQSAINASKEKEKDLYIDTFTADSGVVTAVTIDKNTGEIVSQQSLGSIGNQQGGSGTSNEIDTEEVKALLVQDIMDKKGVREIFSIYAQYLDPNEILRIYNSTSDYGPAKESAEELARLGVDVEQFGY